MAIAAPLLPFLPLVAKQILLNNFLSDVPSMAISTDSVDPERVTQPQRWNITEIRRYHDRVRAHQLGLRPRDLRRAAPGVPRRRGHIPDILVRGVAADRARRRAHPAHARARVAQPAKCLLLWTTVAATVFALAVPFFGPGSRLFGFVPLSTVEMGTVVGICAAYLGATEATKRWFFRPSA